MLYLSYVYLSSTLCAPPQVARAGVWDRVTYHRQEATAAFREWDEGMFQTGLRAAAQRVPFLPMRAGLGSAVLENDPTLRTVTSPYAAASSGRSGRSGRRRFDDDGCRGGCRAVCAVSLSSPGGYWRTMATSRLASSPSPRRR